MLNARLLARLKVGPVHIGSITISLEYRKCGKNCRTCIHGSGHGPYVYTRQQASTRRSYLCHIRDTEQLQAFLDTL